MRSPKPCLPAAACPSRLNNTALEGGDLVNGTVTAVAARGCCAKCAARPDCKVRRLGKGWLKQELMHRRLGRPAAPCRPLPPDTLRAHLLSQAWTFDEAASKCHLKDGSFWAVKAKASLVSWVDPKVPLPPAGSGEWCARMWGAASGWKVPPPRPLPAS